MRPRFYANIFKLVLLVTGIFIIAFQPLEVAGYQGPKYIKVGLKHGATAVEQCELSSDSGFILGRVSDKDGFQETLPLPAYKSLLVTISHGHMEVRDKKGVLLSADIGTGGCLKPYDPEQITISIDGQPYRGGLMLKEDTAGKIAVINYLDIEEYLYGVVHMEMGMTNPIEALKAQAITARTYGLLNMTRHSTSGFDVCAGTHCQVYGGYKYEYESTNKAVDETAGLIIYCKDKAVETYYYKNSGGHTQNSEDVWSSAANHLKGKPDPYCPEYPWRAVISFDTLRQKLIQGNMDPGRVVSVRIGERYATGAVASLVIAGEDREVRLEKTKIRDLLGPSLVRSTHFSLGESYENGGEIAEDLLLALLSSEKKRMASASEQIYLVSEKGIRTRKEIGSLSISEGKRTVKVEDLIGGGQKSQIRQEDIALGPELILSGLGYGHGVGMAQDGAIEMAKRGMTYMDILNFYYTDIEVY